MRKFSSLQPKDVNALLDAKDKEGEKGILLAGATNVSNYIKQGRLTDGVIMDISSISGLKNITEVGDALEIGACTTIADLLDSDIVKTRTPFFQESLRKFANPLIRNLATIGGNIADASPAADTAPLLLVGDAVVIAEQKGGKREIPINEFFDKPRKTMLDPKEVITAIRVPFENDKTGVFLKMGNRNSSAISIVSVAVLVKKNGNTIEEIKIAAGSVAPKPLRLEKTEAAFAGQSVDEDAIAKIARTVGEEVSPIADVRGSGEWRKELTINLVARAVRMCLGMED